MEKQKTLLPRSHYLASGGKKDVFGLPPISARFRQTEAVSDFGSVCLAEEKSEIHTEDHPSKYSPFFLKKYTFVHGMISTGYRKHPSQELPKTLLWTQDKPSSSRGSSYLSPGCAAPSFIDANVACIVPSSISHCGRIDGASEPDAATESASPSSAR
jgi:hypothetical protein